MDLQASINAMNKVMRDTRSGYHLTLGALIEALEKTPTDHLVIFENGVASPGKEMSYRGYYSDLAFEDDHATKTVGVFLEQCRKALNATYEGYKGGDFVMGPDTPLWRAEYSTASGIAIIAAQPDGNALVLLTRQVD